LSNESQKGYTFLNPNNTKDKKNQILAELKLYSSKSDEYSQLQALKILGYNSFDEYSIFAKEFIEVSKRLNDKFPSLKSYSFDLVQSAFLKTVQQLKGKLSYVIMPNKNGVASIYNVNDLKQLQTRKVDCCQAVFNMLQACYNTADSNFLMNSVFCGLGSLACAPFGGPWGYGGCALGCISVAAYNYGTQLDGCTVTAQNNSCPESCF
jgi:hypothetical protein